MFFPPKPFPYAPQITFAPWQCMPSTYIRVGSSDVCRGCMPQPGVPFCHVYIHLLYALPASTRPNDTDLGPQVHLPKANCHLTWSLQFWIYARPLKQVSACLTRFPPSGATFDLVHALVAGCQAPTATQCGLGNASLGVHYPRAIHEKQISTTSVYHASTHTGFGSRHLQGPAHDLVCSWHCRFVGINPLRRPPMNCLPPNTFHKVLPDN